MAVHQSVEEHRYSSLTMGAGSGYTACGPVTISPLTCRRGGTVYAAVSKTVALTGLWVRIPPPAPLHPPIQGCGTQTNRKGATRRCCAGALRPTPTRSTCALSAPPQRLALLLPHSVRGRSMHFRQHLRMGVAGASNLMAQRGGGTLPLHARPIQARRSSGRWACPDR